MDEENLSRPRRRPDSTVQVFLVSEGLQNDLQRLRFRRLLNMRSDEEALQGPKPSSRRARGSASCLTVTCKVSR